MGLVSRILLSVAGILLMTLIIIFKWKRRRMERLAALLPGPPALPIFGNLFQVKMMPEETVASGIKYCTDYPSLFRMWLGPMLFVVVHDPEDVQIVLNHTATAEKGYLYKIIKNMFGEGLLTAASHKWKKHRRIIQPAFNSKFLERFLKKSNGNSRSMFKMLEKEVGRGTFNIFKSFEMLDLRNIFYTSFGIDIGDKSKLNEVFLKAILKSARMQTFRGYRVWLHPDCIYKMTEQYRKEMIGCELMKDLARNVIREKVEENNTNTEDALEDSDLKHCPSFVDLLVRNYSAGNLSEEEVVDEILTLTITGTETTTSSKAMCLLMLAIHQNVQEKAYEEIYSVFGDSDREPTMEDLAQLTYLEQVVNETLRRWSPAFYIIRSCTEDLQLSKHTIPAGCEVFIPIGVMHLKEEIFSKPFEFDPERFSPENCAQRHKFSFIPFGGGPRFCIGAKYAMLSVKSTVSSVLRKYRLDTDATMKDVRMSIGIISICTSGFPVRLTKRGSKEDNCL